jgi:hypothetical protein
LLRGHTVCDLLAHRLGVLPRMQEIERLRQRELVHQARYVSPSSDTRRGGRSTMSGQQV